MCFDLISQVWILPVKQHKMAREYLLQPYPVYRHAVAHYSHQPLEDLHYPDKKDESVPIRDVFW